MSEGKVSLNQPLAPVQPQEMVVPTDLVPLPSEGFVYPPDSPLAGHKTIEIRSMTARDEDILTSRALIRSGRVISALLRSCILNKDIDVEKMLTGDRNAALIGIRITGYGAAYPVNVNCPVCASDSKFDVDLTKLPIKEFPKDKDGNLVGVVAGVNEFSFTMPVCRKIATFKLLTGEEERELMQTLERGRKTGGPEELVTTRLKMQVLSIGGERDLQRLAAIIRNLPARDSRELRKYIDSITPGVDLRTTFACGNCSHQGEVEVPLGTDFFWPEG
jgi:hypothetical protein